jgi:hypothetical protein
LLAHARRELGSPPVLALTATAPKEVSDDIIRGLRIPDATIINTGIERENLLFEVRRTPTKQNKLLALLEIVSKSEGTGIVYTATIPTANEVAQFLNDNHISTTNYHAKLSIRARQEAYQLFMSGKSQVMRRPRHLVWAWTSRTFAMLSIITFPIHWRAIIRKQDAPDVTSAPPARFCYIAAVIVSSSNTSSRASTQPSKMP